MLNSPHRPHHRPPVFCPSVQLEYRQLGTPHRNPSEPRTTPPAGSNHHSPASPPGSNRSTTFLARPPRLGSGASGDERDMGRVWSCRWRGLLLLLMMRKEGRRERSRGGIKWVREDACVGGMGGHFTPDARRVRYSQPQPATATGSISPEAIVAHQRFDCYPVSHPSSTVQLQARAMSMSHEVRPRLHPVR